MKPLYPAPLTRPGSRDYLHKLQSRLAHRTRGKSYRVRHIRCNIKLLVARVLDRLEYLLS
jgi:hypothetical protein